MLAHIFQRRDIRLVIGILAAGIISSAAVPRLQAAPVTLRFEAQVASVFESNGGLALPFGVNIGETLSGTFAFDPSSMGSPYLPTGSLSFLVSGTYLTLSDYRIQVNNNDFPGPIDITGRIADPLNTPAIDFFPPINDNIIISALTDGLPLLGPLPGSVSGHPELSFSPQMVFAYDDAVLDSQALPSDPAIWNRFSFREMSLTIRDASGGGSYIGAYIGQVRGVPEPESIGQMLLGVGCLISLRAYRQR